MADGPRNSDVYERLRAMAIGPAFEPGARIRVDELVGALGSGRTPIREALFQLSAESLVEFRYQRGFHAAKLDRDDLCGLIATKTQLERLLLLDPLAERSAQWERALVVALHDLSRAPALSASGGYEANRQWLAAHRAFHHALVDGSPNRWAVRLADMLDAGIDRYRSRLTARSGPAGPMKAMADLNALDTHRALHDLALARDMAGLAAALERHNGGTLDLFSAWLAD